MQCNIDARGRRIRLIGGLVCLIGGLVLFACLPWFQGWTIPIASGCVLIALGTFQIYESRKGWCALRAIGVKTPV